ncbi:MULTISPECIES: hypothetical protein [Flavobacterium]|uniref:Lipoprotein n=1 Tax=Flavobacterium jumunjinense TaxID=998845 RepID=A0ABV5GQ02_9FLAO|nr:MULTISPECIES: hypothetical protein [Flavobacterium]
MKTTLYILSFLFLFGCKKITNELNIDENKLDEISEAIMEDNTVDLFIRKDSFLGISIYDSINEHKFILTKQVDTIYNPEQDCYVLSTIQYENLAKVITKGKNKNSIDRIIITSPEAKTELGISVGTSFKYIKEKISAFEIKNSESGRRYIQDSNFKYFLNDNTSNTISDSLKVTQIIIE